MSIAAGVGYQIQPPSRLLALSDREAAERLRNRVAREIAIEVSCGNVDGALLLQELVPTFRWLDQVCEEGDDG